MYLKEIVANGFKSFADKLDIKLDDEITCIVGPNGSGKSNVVDAVRWVLGEQSVKSLRGNNSMSDVIFSGSKSRNPLNTASVELVFDNSDHFINLDYEEVAIRRRVYRSGENEYYLNNEQCRLKDITNLLMDSSIGKEAFNIISQGEVEKIFSASAQDRRTIFEEAAGILKYKRRKEEALRKLDRTHSNIERVNDIISELERQIEPLKKQRELALLYKQNKEGLDNYEVALLVYDIETINRELAKLKEIKTAKDSELVTLNNEINIHEVDDSNNDAKLLKLEEEETNLNKNLLEVSTLVTKINGEKEILQEKSKSATDNNKLQEEMRYLLEEKAKIEGNINIIKEEINNIVNDSNKVVVEENTITNDLDRVKAKRNLSLNNYSVSDRELKSLEGQIDYLKRELEDGGYLPSTIKAIIKNKELRGIHNTIENVIKIDEKYSKALNISLASSRNFIITDTESDAKEAINYLKDNRLGRATFFPISVIKRRYVDTNTLDLLDGNTDYLGIMSAFVDTEPKYRDIIENQLGNILVCSDMEAALRVSKIIDKRYKIVTLEGDVIHVGGSMSGGSSLVTKNNITMKNDLLNLIDEKQIKENNLKELDNEIKEINIDINKIEEDYFAKEKIKVALKEKYNNKELELNNNKEALDKINNQITNNEAISNNTISLEEKELIDKYNEKKSEQTSISNRLSSIKDEISALKEEMTNSLANKKLVNSKIHDITKIINDTDISINRLEVKLDTMLNTLTVDKEMTFTCCFSVRLISMKSAPTSTTRVIAS
jgi:chromosome segregation protein